MTSPHTAPTIEAMAEPATRREPSPLEAALDRVGDRWSLLIVEAGGKPITDADDLHAALTSLETPFEVKLVRGNDERTVQVGGGTTATGEA